MNIKVKTLVRNVMIKLTELGDIANSSIYSPALGSWINDIFSLIDEMDECFVAIEEGEDPEEIWLNYDSEELKDYFWEQEMPIQSGNYEGIVERIDELETSGKSPEDLKLYQHVIVHYQITF
ncbi:hypothetical protein A3732_00355 [Oleiphilus sp. HI0050]|nr:hypothetical protein A3732_00355 [Oleiphilus sp. HI0050]